MNHLLSSAIRVAPAAALILCLLGCDNARSGSAAESVPRDTTIRVESGDSDTLSPQSPALLAQAASAPREKAPRVIRGIYLNAYAAGSRNRLNRLLEIAADSEINAFVIDVKDERGIHYRGSKIPLANELSVPTELTIRDLGALADTLRAHGIWSIGRIVVFKDPVLAEARPDWSIQTPAGSVWADRAGNHWVSPWDPNVWEYNIQIAEEVARAGFDEIQFDYIRFPEPYRRTLPPQVHRHAQGNRTDAVAAFLNAAKARLHQLGTPVGVDLFGLSPNTFDDVDIGQQWETLAAVADHVLPMVYPSHYLPTHLPGVTTPNRMPYETVYKSVGMAVIRNERLREAGVEPARLVVWLQAFNAPWVDRGNPFPYGPDQLLAQTQALYDIGVEDWILWNPGSRYEQMMEGFASTAEPRATQWTPDQELVTLIDQFERRGVLAARQRAVEQAAGRTTDPEAAASARTGQVE